MWFRHVVVIRKIGILKVPLVKGNFATRKYHFKLSTGKKQLTTHNFISNSQINLKRLKLLSSRKKELVTRKSIYLKSQLATRNSQLATTCTL